MKAKNLPTVRCNRGFTAVEISVTLATIGVVVALGVQRVDSSAWRLDAAAQEVVQRVRAARSLAVLRQHNVVVTFDIDSRAMIVHEDANSDGVVDEGERVRRETLDGKAEFMRAAAPFADFTGGPVTFDDNSVTFMRNGSASQEGAVYVGRPNVAKARVVIISRATGYSEMQRYNGSTWISR
jgi:Tfp pilus assembly protein FimT